MEEPKVRDEGLLHFSIYKRNIEKDTSTFLAWAPTLKQARLTAKRFGVHHYYIFRHTVRKVEAK